MALDELELMIVEIYNGQLQIREKTNSQLVLDKIVIFNYLRIPIIRRVQLANTDTDTDSYRIPIVAIMVDEKIKLMNH